MRPMERSRRPVKRTLTTLGIFKPTFCRWFAQYRHLGEVGLENRRSGPGRAWNHLPDTVREQIFDLALEQPELSQSHPV